MEKAGIALVVIALMYSICTAWNLYSGVPLSDPGGYPAMAKASRYFYDSGTREPVPVFLTKAMLAFGLNDDASVRCAGVIVFSASVLLMIFLVGKIYGVIAGITSAMVFAFNPYAGYYSVQGVSNLPSGLFLMIFWFLLAKENMSGKNAVFAGIAGGLCMLTRLENILIVLAALCLHTALDISKRRVKFSAFVLAVSVFLTMPYLAHQYRRYGTPVYSHAMAARFWLNTEEKGPLSGDRYNGGPISMSSFILRKGPVRAAGNLLKAYGESFFFYIPRLLYFKLLLLAALSGILFILKRKDYFTLLLLPVLILPIAFISDINQVSVGSGIELRFYLNTLWILCIYCAMGINGTAAFIVTYGRAER